MQITKETSKIKLVYIAGIGHSGSTLLDLILGAHDKIESVGEIKNLKRFIVNDKKCSCGQRIDKCCYWGKILKEYQAKLKEKGIKDNIYDFRTYDKKIFLTEKLRAFFDGYEHIFTKKEIREYGYKNYYLFQSIIETTGRDIILDSSKNPYRLALLSLSDLFDIKVIYLFRDGRANLESKKRKANDNQREEASYPGSVSQTLKFIKLSLYVRNILKHYIDSNDIYGLRYKDFTQNCKREIKGLCSFLDIEYQKEILDNNSSTYFGSRERHNIGGNRLRFKQIDQIRYINKWKNNLTFNEKMCFKLLGGSIINKTFDKFQKK
ncbi:sulfotransferase [Sporohalobacter salinus]|uniref:sulfotransferase n=1 Tax=Sporohalobacter salinus TaxID=1494606 RepID=UPI001960B687|nr:sulfotransferase [Sporohalobacter salinus]MBM7622957.1 hypothetical protein [Sporohalobacter salinus]